MKNSDSSEAKGGPTQYQEDVPNIVAGECICDFVFIF